MVKPIASTELRLGMFIHKLGGSWMTHPFLRGSFLLKDAEDIKRIIEAGIKEVWIDDEKGEHIETEATQTAAENSSEPIELIQPPLKRKNLSLKVLWKKKLFVHENSSMMLNHK